jgi:hypothetical protein
MSRALTENELAQAAMVFETGVNLDRIRISENSTWTNLPPRLAAWLRRQAPPQSNNAITFGNHLHFPLPLNTSQAAIERGELIDMAWLIHELTHAWQFQHLGWRYLPQALLVQIRLGSKAYDYGGAEGLRLAAAASKSWGTFNPEQQGDIARDFYTRLMHAERVSEYLPYVDVLRNPQR